MSDTCCASPCSLSAAKALSLPGVLTLTFFPNHLVSGCESVLTRARASPMTKSCVNTAAWHIASAGARFLHIWAEIWSSCHLKGMLPISVCSPQAAQPATIIYRPHRKANRLQTDPGELQLPYVGGASLHPTAHPGLPYKAPMVTFCSPVQRTHSGGVTLSMLS